MFLIILLSAWFALSLYTFNHSETIEPYLPAGIKAPTNKVALVAFSGASPLLLLASGLILVIDKIINKKS